MDGPRLGFDFMQLSLFLMMLTTLGERRLPLNMLGFDKLLL